MWRDGHISIMELSRIGELLANYVATDITSDLDEVRTKNLLTLIGEKDQQVFVTGTRVADGFQDYEIYQVADNRLTKEEKENG